MISDKDMVKHVVKEWNRDDVYIVLPRDTKPKQEWFKATTDDVKVVKGLGSFVKPEWKVQVHGLFNLHVKYFPLKREYTIEQIDFDLENIVEQAQSLK